jgi:acetyl/propionyl-CoA carboxylase alpha subunit
MQVARILALRVSAKRVCNIAAMADGRLEASTGGLDQVGATVARFDRRKIVQALGQPSVDAHGVADGRLKHDALFLRSVVDPLASFSIGEVESAAFLEQWMCRRQSMWRARYERATDLVVAASSDRRARLSAARTATLEYLAAAEGAHAAEGTTTATVRRPTTVMENRIAAVATRHLETVQTHSGDINAAVVATQVNAESLLVPAMHDGSNWVERQEKDPTILVQRSVSTIESDAFMSPLADSIIRSSRLLADMGAELLEEDSFALRLPHLAEIWANELSEIDSEIKKAQVQYLDAYLMSPIDGRVVQLNKRDGDFARRGETVVIVESESDVELAGQVRSKSSIKVGAQIVVKAPSVFKDGNPVALTGKVSSVRGYDAKTDRWMVTLACKNDGSILPIGYEFDPDPAASSIEIL